MYLVGSRRPTKSEDAEFHGLCDICFEPLEFDLEADEWVCPEECE